MKQILRSLCTLLMLVVWASGFAADKTYSYTFKKGDFSASQKTNTLNGVNWTLATTCTKFGFDTQYSRGFSIGSGQVDPKNPVYSTSEISGTIKEITVNAACNANKSVDLEVTVNNVAYSTGSTGSTKVALTKSSTNYTFTGGASGEIKIKYTTSDKTGVYIKSIKVIYEEGPTKTLKSLAISGNATKKAYNDGDVFDPTGLVVTGTYDDASTEAIKDGITWATTPATLAVGNTSCSVTATVNGVTSPAYEVTGLTVTKAITLSIDPAIYEVVKAPVKVTLTATHGATIYYTLNGDAPSTNSTKYDAPFEVTKSGTTVKALAVADGAEDVTAEATYTIKPDQPVFSDGSKTFSDAFDVTLSLPASTDATSKIYYAIGKTATAESSLYNGPINISAENDGNKVVLHAVVVDQYGNVGKEKYCTYTKTTAFVFDFTANPNAWGITPSTNVKNEGENVVAGKELAVEGVVMTATNGTSQATCLYSKDSSVSLNVYQGGSITFTAPEGYNITEITFDKTNSLKADKETYNNGTWTGNAHEVKFSNNGKKIEIKTATIKLVAIANPTLTLEEAADDTDAKIATNNGKTVDVTLTRTLTADKWNTICLPFDVTAEQIASVLKSAGNVKEYGSEEVATSTIKFKDATTMQAGTPYLIKPTESATTLEFKGVTIKNVDAVDRMVGDKYNMCGVFGKYEMNTDGTELFLKTDGKFYVPEEGKATMKGFRAYFIVPTNTASAALNLSFGEATGIDGVAADAVKNVKVYNVNGQYVGTSLDALPKGLYIVGGKKVLK